MRITTVLLASSLVLGACGSKPSPGPSAPETEARVPADPATGAATERVARQFGDWRDTMPDGATALVSFNITRLARSPVVHKLAAAIENEAGDDLARLRQLAADCQIDFPGDFTGAVFAVYEGGSGQDSGQMVGMIRGSFDQAQIADCISRAARQEGDAVKIESIEGYPVYGSANAEDDAAIAVPEPGLLLLASNPSLMASALRGTDRTSVTTELNRLAFSQPQDEAVWFAAVIDPQHHVATVLRDQVGVPLSEPLRAVFGHVATTDTLSADGGVVLGSPADAGKLLDFASQQIAGLGPLFEAQGLGGVLNTLEMAQKGDRLTVKLRMTAEELDLVMRQIR